MPKKIAKVSTNLKMKDIAMLKKKKVIFLQRERERTLLPFPTKKLMKNVIRKVRIEMSVPPIRHT